MSRYERAILNLRWVPAYCWQRLVRRDSPPRTLHVILAVADHFEPSFLRVRNAPPREQRERIENWCRRYPPVVGAWRDSDGRHWRHTYFYPAEQYDESVISPLIEFCQAGWGEIEIHLHHGVGTPDTAENTRRLLLHVRDALARKGCLSRWNGEGAPRYAFVHGNWALANSDGGRNCGVDEELQILAETGCYADFTLPSAPSGAQIAKINSLYECTGPLGQRAAHRSGRDLRRGEAPGVYPLIIQGPLLPVLERRNGRWRIGIENGCLSGSGPPTGERFQRWLRARIRVEGRPDWLFIKLYSHGMDPEDQPVFFGGELSDFLRELTTLSQNSAQLRLHFVTAREMVNIALAACDEKQGEPSEFRDYRLKPIFAAH